MIYSARCAYAIRAMCRLAAMNAEGYVRVQQLCEGTDLPLQFVAKIFQDLVRAGLLTSSKGPGGGFALAKPIKDVCVYDIVNAVDGTEHLHQCVVGLSNCDDKQPCPQHEAFAPLRCQIVEYMRSTTLEEISNALNKKLKILGMPIVAAPKSK